MSVILVLSHFNMINIQPISFNIHVTMGGVPCLQLCTLLFYLKWLWHATCTAATTPHSYMVALV